MTNSSLLKAASLTLLVVLGLGADLDAAAPMLSFPGVPAELNILSADDRGATFVGQANINSVESPSRWTQATGLQALTSTVGVAAATNADGAVVAGFAELPGTSIFHAFRWTDGGGLQDLGSFSGDVNNGSFATSVDRSGSVVVGYSYLTTGATHAFRWTAQAGLQDLGTPGRNGFSIAQGVSGNGAVVVGYAVEIVRNQSVQSAFRWDAARGIAILRSLGGPTSVAMTADELGDVVVGASSLADGAQRAARWVGSDGAQDLGAGPNSLAEFVTGDGVTVIGAKSDGPFIWRKKMGSVNLNAHLASQGVNLGGTSFVRVVAIAPDLSTISGSCSTNQGSGVFQSCVLSNLNLQPCTPANIHRACRSNNCGTAATGCGGDVSCGTCPSGQVCSVSTGAGTCFVCQPQTAAQACGGNTCGSAPDGCGGTVSCGTCAAPDTCSGAGGGPGTCQCVPKTFSEVCVTPPDRPFACGSGSDGCGGTVNCGTCPAGSPCFPMPGGAGFCEACSLLTCGTQTCGVTFGDTCHVTTISCGTCTSGQVCNNGTCQ